MSGAGSADLWLKIRSKLWEISHRFFYKMAHRPTWYSHPCSRKKSCWEIKFRLFEHEKNMYGKRYFLCNKLQCINVKFSLYSQHNNFSLKCNCTLNNDFMLWNISVNSVGKYWNYSEIHSIYEPSFQSDSM